MFFNWKKVFVNSTLIFADLVTFTLIFGTSTATEFWSPDKIAK